jgi:RNA polymerase sigma-70 factor, ECF subfamily
VEQPDAAARFSAIYREHRPQVFAYAVSRVGRQLAEDVVNDAFLVAWRRLHEIPATPLPWLLAVARNVARDRSRSEARHASLAAELRAWITDVSADLADGVAVLAALAQLSDDDREVLTLVAWNGLSASAAAQVVGCSKATFFVRLHRARRRPERAMPAVERLAAPPVPRTPVTDKEHSP